MPAERALSGNGWVALGQGAVLVAVVAGLLTGYFAESRWLVRWSLIGGWGLLILLFLWRIARAVEA